jgi:hypothetical protein
MRRYLEGRVNRQLRNLTLIFVALLVAAVIKWFPRQRATISARAIRHRLWVLDSVRVEQISLRSNARAMLGPAD